VANVRTQFPPGGQKILKKNRSSLKYIQLEIAIIKNEILNLKKFELGKFWKTFSNIKIEKFFTNKILKNRD